MQLKPSHDQTILGFPLLAHMLLSIYVQFGWRGPHSGSQESRSSGPVPEDSHGSYIPGTFCDTPVMQEEEIS